MTLAMPAIAPQTAGMVISHRIPKFIPSRNAFPFPNWFPPGSPVILFETPFGDIRAGDANRGLCGGMIFTVMDYYTHGIETIPSEASDTAFRYFCRRLLASWNLPFDCVKYYLWQTRSGSTRSIAGMKVLLGVSHMMIVNEWPKVRAVLDSNMPAALGLVKVQGFSLNQLSHNHQVLAYGYELDEVNEDLTLNIYDPNYPGDDSCTLRVSLRNPDSERPVFHSCEGPVVRGFFHTEYRRPPEPPNL